MDDSIKKIKYLHSSTKYRVNSEILAEVYKMTEKSGILPDENEPKIKLEGEDLSQLLIRNERMINISRSAMNKVFDSLMDKTRLMFLCDDKGYVIDMASSPEVMQWSFNKGVMLGACLDYYSFGNNSISMAIYCEGPVVIIGNEHYCNLLKSWSCIAFPIKIQNKTVGYLNISDSVQSDLVQLTALVELMAELIGERLDKYYWGEKLNSQGENSNPRGEKPNPDDEEFKPVTDKVQFYGKVIVGSGIKLTIREVDILFYLYTGKSYNDITDALNISANTLKTHLRNIYQKLGVSTQKECFERLNNILMQQ